jgi:O-acetyl-ADP-ribose deacetylase (regulator of RNase III)
MNQSERRQFLIKKLVAEHGEALKKTTPKSEQEEKQILRALFNIRPPFAIDDEILKVQDEYLQEELKKKPLTDASKLEPVEENIYLWQGDITTLICDAIVNAANSQLLGCFCPCHGCIDNAIHTYAGAQLRFECAAIMKKQQHDEFTGRAKLTKAYNLPCRYVLHAVGPAIAREVTKKDEILLASCYHASLKLAEKNNIKSLAFCCISTGEYGFPNEPAAKIAIKTVRKYRDTKLKAHDMRIIFNVFKDKDYEIYKRLLGNA